MISVLLLMLLFAVLQAAVYFYVRNVAASSVADAARFAAAETIALVAPTPAALPAAALVVTHNPVRLPGPPEHFHQGHAQDGERGSLGTGPTAPQPSP